MNTFIFSPEAGTPGGNAEMEIRLWDFIDGRSSEQERSFIEQLLATNLEWKNKYQELLEVHQLAMGHLELDAPSLRFAKNVMEEIGKYQIAPAAKNYIDKKVIWGITLFFLVMIGGFLVYTLGQINWSGPVAGSATINQYNPAKVDWAHFFNNTYTNVFVMVNVVLGLMMLDMYLGKKKKQLREKAGIIE